jgi:hypothetical protein
MRVKDLRVGNAILRKMAKENGFDIENVYLNQYYGYVHTVDVNKPDADFCETEYKGSKYRVEYMSGCFNPFIVKK